MKKLTLYSAVGWVLIIISQVFYGLAVAEYALEAALKMAFLSYS